MHAVPVLAEETLSFEMSKLMTEPSPALWESTTLERPLGSLEPAMSFIGASSSTQVLLLDSVVLLCRILLCFTVIQSVILYFDIQSIGTNTMEVRPDGCDSDTNWNQACV
jgi:hypothetical protein